VVSGKKIGEKVTRKSPKKNPLQGGIINEGEIRRGTGVIEAKEKGKGCEQSLCREKYSLVGFDWGKTEKRPFTHEKGLNRGCG